MSPHKHLICICLKSEASYSVVFGGSYDIMLIHIVLIFFYILRGLEIVDGGKQ